MNTETTQSVLNREVVSDKASRTITIVSSVGNNKIKINFVGNTWGQLKQLLSSGGTTVDNKRFDAYSFSNMKAIESTRNSTLEHDTALIPANDFSLFLLPVQTKSGGAVRDKVKEYFAANREAAREHFGNYTQKKEADLAELLKSYKPSKKSKSKKEVAKKATSTTKKVAAKKVATKKISKTKSSKISKVVESVKKSKVSVSPEEENNILDSTFRTLRDTTPGVRRY